MSPHVVSSITRVVVGSSFSCSCDTYLCLPPPYRTRPRAQTQGIIAPHLEPKWLRIGTGQLKEAVHRPSPVPYTHHVSPLTVQFMLELLPGDPEHRLTPVPAAYAVNRDLYAWQTGMPPEACARELEAHERPYGASVRALEELAPCRRKQGRHRSFPSPSFSSCLAQIHSAEPSGNLGHLNALPSWPPSPGPCAPVRAPKSTVPSRLLPRSSTCGRGQAHFSRRRVRRSKNSRQNCAAGPWYPLRRPQ